VDISTDPSYIKSSSSETIVTNTPVLTGRWQKILSYGYSLNGQEFVIPEGASYNTVVDNTAKAVANGEIGYLGTAMQILGGTNGSTATNNYGKPWSKAVDTGWAPATATASDILTLQGLTSPNSNVTDTYTLAMTYNTTGLTDAQLATGLFCLVTKNASGNWVNAVDLNTGGTKHFVLGAWDASYGLGTYGVDKATGKAWAVVNHASDFAVTQLAPSLTITTDSVNTYVTWPLGIPGYQLQFNPDLNTTNWVPVDGNGFFRLIK
jgi:hypothetical protein